MDETEKTQLADIVAMVELLALECEGLRYIAKNYVFNENWALLLGEYTRSPERLSRVQQQFDEAYQAALLVSASKEVNRVLQLLQAAERRVRYPETPRKSADQP